MPFVLPDADSCVDTQAGALFVRLLILQKSYLFGWNDAVRSMGQESYLPVWEDISWENSF